MAKGTVIRGTPVNTISANNGQGFNAGAKPVGYSGTTTKDQFRGDQSNKIDPRSGTPYNSRSVNDDIQPPSVKPRNGGNPFNDPESNGNGVVFSGVSQAHDYTPAPSNVMDSPVPARAQRPTPNGSIRLNEIRNGVGGDYGPTDSIPDAPNGVLARD